jgi:O-antigen ligase
MSDKQYRLAGKVLLGLLLLLPFYLPLAVWAASNFGSIYVYSAWKEVVLILLALSFAKPLVRTLYTDARLDRWLNRTIAAYVLLAFLYIVSANNLFEFGAGFIFATRFLFVFFIARLLAANRALPVEKLRRLAIGIGMALSAIAVLQAFVLPATLLTHIGYEHIGQEIPGFPPAVTTLGEVSDFIRPQATLRGPNPLGAFLILPFGLLLVTFLKNRNKKTLAGLLLIAMAILLTFSRSAWIGAAIAGAAIIAFHNHNRLRTVPKLPLAAGAIIILMAVMLAINTPRARLILFHENRNSSMKSNELHFELTRNALSDIKSRPLGHGPGKAGPVSVLEDNGKDGRIAENYFLQVGQEVGVVGLLLFMAFHVLVMLRLYRLRDNLFAMTVFAVGLGLMVTNLMLHTWADEVVSIFWWTFAGAAISASLSPKRKVAHG